MKERLKGYIMNHIINNTFDFLKWLNNEDGYIEIVKSQFDEIDKNNNYIDKMLSIMNNPDFNYNPLGKYKNRERFIIDCQNSISIFKNDIRICNRDIQQFIEGWSHDNKIDNAVIDIELCKRLVSLVAEYNLNEEVKKDDVEEDLPPIFPVQDLTDEEIKLLRPQFSVKKLIKDIDNSNNQKNWQEMKVSDVIKDLNAQPKM